MIKNRLMIALVAACAILGVTCTASATTYTNVGDFLANTQPGFYFEDFTGVPTGAVPVLNFGPVNGYSYSITALNDLFNDPGIISTNTASSPIEITFTGAPVTAIGGNFWASDISFNPIAADVTISLSDGTIENFVSAGPGLFRGFTTTGPAITGMTIDASDVPVNAWATMDNFYVGSAVPEPGCAAALLLGALAALAIRRR